MRPVRAKCSRSLYSMSTFTELYKTSKECTDDEETERTKRRQPFYKSQIDNFRNSFIAYLSGFKAMLFTGENVPR